MPQSINRPGGGRLGEERELLAFGWQPLELGVLDDRVEAHQSLEHGTRGHRSGGPAGRLSDGAVEGPNRDVIKLRAIVDTVARSGVPVLHKLVEKGVDVVAVRGAGEPRELTSNADTALEHHGGPET